MMSKQRVEGYVSGPNGRTKVMTEWLEEDMAETQGRAIGLEIRGWENVNVVVADE